jgi:murein DD-endopeptidase MepM/ murein hydrolase activator NlpD
MDLMKLKSNAVNSVLLCIIIAFNLQGCMPPEMPSLQDSQPSSGTEAAAPSPTAIRITPLPTRPNYQPGELVDYTAQTGDTLPALAVRFNTTEREIRENNPVIPKDVTTLPPGFPMKIPIYYRSLWGSPYQILPDWLFINGPAERDFDTVAFVNSQPGWFKTFSVSTLTQTLVGGQIINHIAVDYSVSPRLLLAIVEYKTGALSQSEHTEDSTYPLGLNDHMHQGLFSELTLAANNLNNYYYEYKTGQLTSIERQDGSLEHPDPWQNAASVALQTFFSKVLPIDQYNTAISSEGFAKTYARLFGDPWANPQPHIPGSLTQPPMQLPFANGVAWAFTGGPHTGYGEGEPFSALDFAPPAVVGGCTPTEEYARAVADGIIARTGDAELVLDLDGDNDERTGWTVYYLHLSNSSLIPVGSKVKAGDPLGHPSCEGGHATGTHVHIARKYNGEWIPAGGLLAFNLNGWVAENGDAAYEGKLVRFTKVVRACDCSDQASQLTAASLAEEMNSNQSNP